MEVCVRSAATELTEGEAAEALRMECARAQRWRIVGSDAGLVPNTASVMLYKGTPRQVDRLTQIAFDLSECA